jgi:hypothetical protein
VAKSNRPGISACCRQLISISAGTALQQRDPDDAEFIIGPAEGRTRWHRRATLPRVRHTRLLMLSDTAETLVASQSGSGMAMVTLIDITVSATIRHNDSDPTASEAATARINRCEATGLEGSAKPFPTLGDRIMVIHPSRCGRITCTAQNFTGLAGRI